MTGAANPAGFEPQSARLGALVGEAQRLMDELSAISQRQHEAIGSGDVEKIVELVSAREPVVREIVRVGEELGAFLGDQGAVASVDAKERDAALIRISAIEHAMKRLRERDARDRVLMEAARDHLAAQIAGNGAGKSALRAYSARPVTPNPVLQDRKG